MALTNIQVIDHALNQAQLDSSYRSLARGWINILRQKYADDTNYKRWRTTAANVAFITGTRRYALPVDFNRADSAFLIGSNGQQGAQIFIYDSYDFDPYPHSASGDPVSALIDEKTREIVFNTIPNSGPYYSLNYFYSPTAYAVDGTADSTIPDVPSETLLIQDMILLAYENRDDERYMQKKQEVTEADVKQQRVAPQNVGTSTLQLNQAVFRSRRRRV